jgi:hypothetical protein
VKVQKPSNSGQVVVEYILLLVIGVAIAMLITTQMVSRDPNSPGFLVKKWQEILVTIGNDYPDDM